MTIKGIVIAIVLAGLITWGIVLNRNENSYRRQYCKGAYGQQWYYVNGDRSPSFCANPNGEVRYPQNW